MKLGFYPKLAADSIKKNKKLYLPYILTCCGISAMQYIMFYLSYYTENSGMTGGRIITTTLNYGIIVIVIFSIIFLNYSNSFLLRRRQKEFGIYNILGMSKKNITHIYLWENIIIYLISTVSGITMGIAFSKLAELLLARLIKDNISYDFTINKDLILVCAAVSAFVFLLLFVRGIIALWKLNTLSLMKSENFGEKPPKANYLIAVIGVLMLCVAYYIALTTEKPLDALVMFFVAVILVVIGTYMIFIAGSVTMCKILQKNQKYYYQKDHFVAVSSMAYRMKRNGAGLASVCILITMVLVMMFGAGSLYIGAEDSLHTTYPRDFTFVMYAGGDQETANENFNVFCNDIDEFFINHNDNREDIQKYTYAHYNMNVTDNVFDRGFDKPADKYAEVYFISLADYNKYCGENKVLEDNQVLINTIYTQYSHSNLIIGGESYDIREFVPTDDLFPNRDKAYLTPKIYIIANDINKIISGFDNEITHHTKFIYRFNSSLSQDKQCRMFNDLYNNMVANNNRGKYGSGTSWAIESLAFDRADFYGIYGGIFFLGIILSALFLVATVLIIYFKQIAEGYEDESRFTVMKKIGMTNREIQKNVNSQMKTVFILPLAFAILHLCFAAPIIMRMLTLFSVENTSLILITMAVIVAIFRVFYITVYKITSNVYFEIVSKSNIKKYGSN